MTPTVLADRAREMAEARGVSIQVWGKDELREHGMNAILAVNSGSAQEPRFVMMKYDCGREGAKTLAVVGKGITFDSGGISIKPADHMENMKHDMSGAAATVGFIQAAADLKLPCNVIGIFAATENLPSGTSYKPGDVFKTYQGTFIEIVNTDAEGRVILSDALAYAVEQDPDAIVDLATLTGACVVALGYHASGAMGNDEGLLALMQAGRRRVGRAGLAAAALEGAPQDIESSIADIKNTGGRAGGALTAAAFLQCFVGGKPWVHLDIAGDRLHRELGADPAVPAAELRHGRRRPAAGGAGAALERLSARRGGRQDRPPGVTAVSPSRAGLDRSQRARPRPGGASRLRIVSRADLAVAALFAVLALAFVGPALLPGRALLPIDALFGYPPWQAHAENFGVSLPHNPLIADAILQNYSWKRLARESFAAGELPLWNPYILAGQPFMASGQNGSLYPLGVLFYVAAAGERLRLVHRAAPLDRGAGGVLAGPDCSGRRGSAGSSPG